MVVHLMKSKPLIGCLSMDRLVSSGFLLFITLHTVKNTFLVSMSFQKRKLGTKTITEVWMSYEFVKLRNACCKMNFLEQKTAGK